MDEIEGFRLYLGVAEEARLEALHPPEETPQTFEKFLPYALALDVENEWCERFARQAAEARQAGVSQSAYRPSWYRGGSFGPSNLSGLGHALGQGLSGAASAASRPPGSRGGGGSSGGGSSGGGGGGGGGSGW
jgi:uncharacterized membrane protein